MPIKLPNNLPAVKTLTEENVFVMTDTRAMTQDIRPLQILILNLMPTKIDTETQLTRLLGNTPLQVELELLQTSTHKSQNTSEEHMFAFYKTFDAIKQKNYDGMIITGAPVELLEFEEVEYWDELCEIMEWSRSHVHSTFHICWGAQAGLYYHYGIKKRKLDKKLSGVYKHTLDYKHGMLFRGFDDEFYVPHSRNTTVYEEDVLEHEELRIISKSDEAGIYAIKSKDDRQIFIMGHSEYDAETLKKEYERDKNAGLNPEVPCNYFPDDDDTKAPCVRWRSCANLLYSNWLNYFVYQSTPYDITQIKDNRLDIDIRENAETVVAKFGGSSLADAVQFKKAADIVKSEKQRKYVVVSAPGKRFSGDTKVTDYLIEIADGKDSEKSREILDKVLNRFEAIRIGLDIDMDLEAEFEKIEEGLSVIPAERKRDYIVSRGEYLSAKLMANYIGYDFVDAAELIKFDEKGEVDYHEISERLDVLTQNGNGKVIPGFYGSGADGFVKTFSRGGSDITGAVIAAATGADLYENWTDVSGLLMANPEIVENPVPVSVVTYKELRELSYMGAAVMHEDAMFPVTRLEIPVQIRNTNRPQDDGTLIVKNADYFRSSFDISGISGKKGFISIVIEKNKLNESTAIRENIMKLFADYDVKISNIFAGIDSLNIIVNKTQFAGSDEYESKLKAVTHRIETVLGAKVTVTGEIALIGIIGRNLGTSPAVAVKVLSALAERGINIRLIDHGSGKINMMVGVDEKDYEASIRAIYNQFTQKRQ